MQILYLALGAKGKSTYLLTDMKIWYLALGTKDKITYPLADMQTRYMALGGKGKITCTLADMQIWCLSVPNSRPFRAPNSTGSTCHWPFTDPLRPSTRAIHTLVYDHSLPS